jgi:hypothetical protein
MLENTWREIDYRLDVLRATKGAHFNLMFVPCINKRSIKNQHNAQICTTSLFHMLTATCFDSSLPSSGSFWIRLSYVKNT